MNSTAFEDTLRRFLRSKPFQPFVVELLDGSTIEVDRPKVVIAGGAASLFTPNYELVEFVCEDDRDIRAAMSGTAR